MSKCSKCGNELLTGDIHRELGWCNNCYNELYKVSDLEVKLKESESKRKSLEEKIKFLTEEIEECFVDGQKYNELREQKDKEIQQLKQQLHDLPKKIVSEIKDCLLDFSNGWWRYFITDGCEYMLSSDLKGCLDETIDTILKKYGGEDE